MLKLEVGKKYVSAGGTVFKIVTDEYRYTADRAELQPYVGIGVDQFAGWQNFNSQGKTSAPNSQFNLVSEYKEPRYRWYNLYPEDQMSLTCYSHGTKEGADSCQMPHRIACVRMNQETGEVINEAIR